MPQPTAGDVHVDRPLTNMSVAYLQSLDDFIADKVFPALPVQKQSDRYFTYDKSYWFRTEAQKRAPSSVSAGAGWKVDSTASYYCDVWAVHKDIDDTIRANADEPLDMDRDATEFVTRQMILRREKEFASKFFTTGLWTGSTTGTDIAAGTKWDAASSDPVDDVEEQKEAVRRKTGFKPNKMVVTPQVHRALKSNASILDRIKYTQRAIVTEDILASLFGVEQYLVANATNELAAEGATSNMDFVFGSDGVLLVYAAPRPSILQPSGGYTFLWNGLFGANQGSRIKRFRIEEISSDRIENEAAFAMKLVAADVGVFFNDVLT